MPHLNRTELNDLEGARARLARARARDQGYLGGGVLVGRQLLEQLLAAHDKLGLLWAAGWAVADDGDPYQHGGV